MVLDAAQAFGRLSPAAQVLYRQEQEQLFQRVCGGEQAAAEAVALAQAALAKADPGLVDQLARAGGFADARVVGVLANIGRTTAIRHDLHAGRTTLRDLAFVNRA